MVQSFLSPFNYHHIKQNFFKELQRAAHGQPSSLSWLTHILPEKPLIREGIIQGIVIGGTNYILQTEKLKANGICETLSYQTGTLPIINDKQTLLTFLINHVDKRAEALGLNFGFAMEAISGKYGAIDGRLLYGTKEHTFSGLIGCSLADLVREATGKDIPVAVANDTVCLTLSGKGIEHGALIAGTGFNLGMRQTKYGERECINFEAGNFNKFPPDEELTIIDQQSEKPGAYLYEKVISGKYLSIFFNAKAKKLGIDHKQIKTSQELSYLSNQTSHTEANLLAREIIQRSAKLVAVALAALYDFCLLQKIISDEEPMEIVGEGSLLWKGWQYHKTIKDQLKTLGLSEGAIVIKHIKNSSINGALGLVIK